MSLNKNGNGSLDSWYKSSMDAVSKKCGLSNRMAVPRFSRVVINVGLKESVVNSKFIITVENVLRVITGQKPVRTFARKSVAGFKIRKGMPVGVCVTMRGLQMKNFLRKLIGLALPRVRDFRGIKKVFDGRWNYNLGLKDISIFPETEAVGGIDFSYGANVSLITTAKNGSEVQNLMESFGFPFCGG